LSVNRNPNRNPNPNDPGDGIGTEESGMMLR
jgi:hypothetical protein